MNSAAAGIPSRRRTDGMRRIHRVHFVWPAPQAFLREVHRLPQLFQEFLLDFRRGVQLGAAQERVVAADEFAFERPVAEHLAEQNRLGEVIV